MATKRDQLHAQQFLGRRVVSALVTRETDPEQPPFRDPGRAALAGIAVAVLALAAFGVYGLIVPGGANAWRDGRSVLVEKETGTRYVYLDGRLHPVANYASALFALGTHADVRTVSRESLVGVPRGPRIGIPDAPDALPGRDRVLDGGWTLCSRLVAGPTGETAPESVVLVGREPDGGSPLADRALLLAAPDSGDRYLVSGGHRHRVAEADAVPVGLALRSAAPLRVSPALVDALPAGRQVAPLPVPDAGAPSKAVPGRDDLRVGQLAVVQTSDGGVRHHLVEADRLRPISALQYDVQRAFKPTAAAYGGREPVGVPLGLIAAGEATVAPVAAAEDGDPPAVRPEFATGGAESVVCLVFDPGARVPRVVVDPVLPRPDPLTATRGRTDGGAALADRVVVPAGWVALVEAVAGPEAPAGTVLVVTDQGRAHPLADRAGIEVLGYAGARPVRLPAGLVARVPVGSSLGHEAALAR